MITVYLLFQRSEGLSLFQTLFNYIQMTKNEFVYGVSERCQQLTIELQCLSFKCISLAKF